MAHIAREKSHARGSCKIILCLWRIYLQKYVICNDNTLIETALGAWKSRAHVTTTVSALKRRICIKTGNEYVKTVNVSGCISVCAYACVHARACMCVCGRVRVRVRACACVYVCLLCK